jgi:hypothetical protein
MISITPLKARIGFGDLTLSLERSGTSHNFNLTLALKTGKEFLVHPNVQSVNVTSLRLSLIPMI